MVTSAIEEKMEKMTESGINLSDIPSIPKSGIGLMETIIGILSENEIRMNFRDFKMDGEVRFRLEPIKKG
ncbi:hypothetical protein A3L09_08040 [Thermococcus profundus]|uniref:Uncharacterized protein n=1 Tax=Thermococcus profundus TaxID=49899 RepID=A0A2Z2MBK9_THEPR|nr:hypothetical protein [Thermococcus profundus]ASJ03206.1 hypothetical protein A3L09_08040 [Thermococcus profundus]